jgi:hypothetical protein
VVFAVVNKGPSTPKPPAATSLPSTPPSGNPTSPPTLPPSQSPRPTSPSAPPTQPPGPGGGGGKAVQTSFATIFVPDGFDDQGANSSGSCTTDTLRAPNNDGLVMYGLCMLPGGTTQSAFDQVLLSGDQQALDPNAKLCEPTKTGGNLKSSGGTIPVDGVSICLDVTPQSGPAFHAIDFYFAGIAKASDGSTVGVTLNIFAPADSYNEFVKSLPDGVFSQTVFNASP